LEEVERILRHKFCHSEAQVLRRITGMRTTFPEAMVDGYQDLIPAMTNDPGDRHVLAAAVKCGAHSIVSDNTKHFPKESLEPYGLECLTADQFLGHQYHIDPDTFISVLLNQAEDIGWTLQQLISKHVPSLSTLISTRGS
jgi:hypothetical protein